MTIINIKTPLTRVVGSKTSRYAIHLKTSRSLTDPYNGLNVCLVDKDGKFVMKRFDTMPHMMMRGNVDVFTFEGPRIEGGVSSMIVSQEQGVWGLEEAMLFENDVLVGKFFWRDTVGNGNAASMTLYKSPYDGMSKEELRKVFNEEYSKLKDQIKESMAHIGVIGTMTTGFALGAEKAAAFGIGSGLAFLYAFLLEAEMDKLGTGKSGVNVASRLLTIFGMSVGVVKAFETEIRQDNALFVLGLVGFLTFKASVIKLMKP